MELERHKIDVASEAHDPAVYQFLVGMKHINDEDDVEVAPETLSSVEMIAK